ncbi:MAG: SpoIIE family protein phosphatase [Clostridia bacterium]|nr:SpoIIE family protein phosphatase [Clostridia bacterium]
MRNKKQNISGAFGRWLLVLVVIAFLATTAFLWISQTKISQNNAINLLELNISDVREDIIDASDENLLKLTNQIADDLNQSERITSELLAELTKKYGVTEINCINSDGIIFASTYPDFLNYDMRSGGQSAEFMVLLSDETEYVQSYQPVSYDASISRKYGGVTLENGGFVQVGYGAERFQKDIDEFVVGVTRNRHVGEGGSIIIVDENWNIVSDRYGNEGENLDVTGIWIDTDNIPENEAFTADVYGEPCYCMHQLTEGYRIVAVMPKSEAALSRNVSVGVTTVMQIIVFAALFIMIFMLVKRLVVENIYKVNDSLSAITEGNLDTVVDVRSHIEFDALSDDINSTVNTLKKYISEAEARIDAELAFAKAIQHSALPSVFPPYPNRKEFDISATMHTAKEVGGDFYDFYFVDEDTLAFLVADVSGKGIPAAMFMMQSKTLLKSYAESGMSVEDVFTNANEKLCEGNDAGMFVTAWMGLLNTKTGLVTFANAGHNPPLIKRADGSFSYLKTRPGFVLAGMEGIRYRKNEYQLEKGDIIYLYTDGVTEAMNTENELYGEKRLLEVLNKNSECGTQKICHEVKADVDLFVGEASRFDDITMLCLKFNGEKSASMKEITVAATVENIQTVTDFINEQLEAFGCPMKAKTQIDIAVDEIFGNIAHYAYTTETGDVTVSIENGDNPQAADITFIDSGVPYNPLIQAEPDITLSADKRQVGGLGIFIAKNIMDEISYEYKDGMNILKIRKCFS